MLNIVIPAAGNGQRFKEAGYSEPKPLIPIQGKPMIARVIDNLRPKKGHFFHLVVQEKHKVPQSIFGSSKGILNTLSKPTRGAVETLLYAYIYTGELLLANCDQLVETDVNEFINTSKARIMTFNSTNPHHSYVKIKNGLVTDIAEKQLISDNAVLGWYYFPDCKQFMEYAEKALKSNKTFNNELYISSVIDLMIKDGIEVEPYEIDVHKKHILGTPEELKIFLDKGIEL